MKPSGAAKKKIDVARDVDLVADAAIRQSIITKSDRHKDAYTSLNQDRSTYMSTYELTEKLARWIRSKERTRGKVPGKRVEDRTGGRTLKSDPLPYPEGTLRWCRKWFGPLPKERTGGKGNGYRIPHGYLYVARAWWLSTDQRVRTAAMRLLLADPKPWLVVVGKFGSTHYTLTEVVGRVESLLPLAQKYNQPIQILNVGPMEGDKGDRSEDARQG